MARRIERPALLIRKSTPPWSISSWMKRSQSAMSAMSAG
jgi:hypothetical protein